MRISRGDTIHSCAAAAAAASLDIKLMASSQTREAQKKLPVEITTTRVK